MQPYLYLGSKRLLREIWYGLWIIATGHWTELRGVGCTEITNSYFLFNLFFSGTFLKLDMAIFKVLSGYRSKSLGDLISFQHTLRFLTKIIGGGLRLCLRLLLSCSVHRLVHFRLAGLMAILWIGIRLNLQEYSASPYHSWAKK